MQDQVLMTSYCVRERASVGRVFFCLFVFWGEGGSVFVTYGTAVVAALPYICLQMFLFLQYFDESLP